MRRLIDWIGDLPRPVEDAIEQVLHFAWTFVAILVYAAIPVPIVNGLVAGVVFALPRELVDQWPIERPRDTVKDLIFFGLGGSAASAIDHWLIP